MKKVLGLDLGTTSIGWALVNQAETPEEKSSIIRAGVRVNPLSVDEKDCFEKGKDVATNSDRRLKRSMRRNLQRYKLRRENLIALLKEKGWIDDLTVLAESGIGTTFETYALRAKAPVEEISLSALARVLLMINKKRGYKSSRKIKSGEDGKLFDGIAVAKELAARAITPGQYSLELLKQGKKYLPDFYASDLQDELRRICGFQKQYYPEFLTAEFIESIRGKGRNEIAKLIKDKYAVLTADNKGKNKKIQAFTWRTNALTTRLGIEELAYVIADISGTIKNSSGYLGAISNRSKELQFNNETVGQYLYRQIKEHPGQSIKNTTFYRQDYIDEFETIWEKQSAYHKELTPELKKAVRDEVIFFQRRLKSQKALISNCEFEKHHKAAPKSSLLFQEFRTWQILNNVVVIDKESGEQRLLSLDEMNSLASELFVKGKLSSTEALKILFKRAKGYELNYKSLEGNTTVEAIAEKLLEIINVEDDRDYVLTKMTAEDVLHVIATTFKKLGYNEHIMEEPTLSILWHLLYSYEGDNSRTGEEGLIRKLVEICKIPKEYAALLADISFEDDYGSLSSRAMRKILPYLKEGNTYDKACFYAGYNHSHSETTEERENKELKDRLDILPKNSLRNPVVEKIINQMINVVNAVSERYGKPDEINIELARSLKDNKQKRAKRYEENQAAEKENKRISDLLKSDFGFTYVRKSDIERYRLYEELKPRGYKTLYSGQYIPREKLFSKEIDIEHIIPQSVLFNDSFSNKTLEYRAVNIEKADATARDYVALKYGDDHLAEFKADIDDLRNNGSISWTKAANLWMRKEDLPEDFLERDLTMSGYIAKKAKDVLNSYVRVVLPTSGKVTSRLREDWQLVDVMKEINMPKYEKLGMTFVDNGSEGRPVKRIKDWSKRNDHRHHAMDALTIAFTRPSHIQYLNHMSAKDDKSSAVYGIMVKETIRTNNGRIFLPPMPLDELRAAFRKELESVLVSIKAKNKVVTRNVNKSRKSGGYNTRIELTPRGALHKETIYGSRMIPIRVEIPVGAKLTEDIIATVAKKSEREALAARLAAFGGDPKKAFTGKNSIENNPIFVDAIHSKQIGPKVACIEYKQVYSIRKAIDPSLNVEKVLDKRIKELLQARLEEHGGNTAKAFSNLDENPIWLNRDRGIAIKTVTIAENFEELQPLHEKHDNLGRLITDADGNKMPTDYVNLRNNHHVAIYEDSEGNYHEKVVSFFEALERISAGLRPVDKDWKRDEGYKFVFSLKINEMFVFPNEETGFYPKELDLMKKSNYSIISPNLFRVQKLAKGDYWFRHHLETVLNDNSNLQDVAWKRVRKANGLKTAVKVRLNHIGEIVAVGEYD